MNSTSNDLTGKVALVTGSSRGIGRAVALEFAAAGADVLVHYLSAEAEAEQVAVAIRSLGRRTAVVQADVRRAQSVTKLVDTVVSGFGRVDILVNNAGYALVKDFLITTEEEWVDQLDTLANGYFRFTRAVIPKMVERGGGVILNIASTCGVRGGAGEVAYAAANGAIVALTRSLAGELGPKGIRVNALLVAWASNAFDPNNPAHTAFLPQFPLRRVTQVAEIAKAAVYLCSGAANAVTGTTLPVNAGYLCG